MKREVIDLGRMVHVDPKGIERPLSLGERRGPSVYIERDFRDHPVIKRFRAWHFPALGWRVCVYEAVDGPWPWDWYVDIARITEAGRGADVGCGPAAGDRLEVLDLYVDVAVREGRSYELLDLDELAGGLRNGEITAGDAAWALERAQHLCDLLAENDFSMRVVVDKAVRGELGAERGGAAGGRRDDEDGPISGAKLGRRSRHGATKWPRQ
ncbi:MAG: DUF402 domain-containing protein [Bacillota bacterium]